MVGYEPTVRVVEYIWNNPCATKNQIIKATGVSRNEWDHIENLLIDRGNIFRQRFVKTIEDGKEFWAVGYYAKEGTTLDSIKAGLAYLKR